MPTRTIGIVIDGATGRLGTTQHLRALLAWIRAQAGEAATCGRGPRGPLDADRFANEDSGSSASTRTRRMIRILPMNVLMFMPARTIASSEENRPPPR